MRQKTLQKILRAKGLKHTVVRAAILRALESASKPLSVQELLTQLQKKGVSPHKVTLYRELDTLEQHALTRTIQLPGQTERRVETASQAHHHHLVCIGCGTTEAVRAQKLEEKISELQKELQQQTGFTKIQHMVEFSGHCQKCYS